MTTRSGLRGAGVVAAMGWLGLVVMSACAGEDPEAPDVGGESVAEVEQEAHQGQCCGGALCGCTGLGCLCTDSGNACCNAGFGLKICKNLQTDTTNCGSCGHVCGAGQGGCWICNAGTCEEVAC